VRAEHAPRPSKGGLRSPLLLALAALLAACATPGLRPGIDREADLLQRLGAPAMSWPTPDGGRQLAWPEGPWGFRTLMAVVAADGRLVSIGNVLDSAHFARIQPGMGEDEVLRLLGPPQPQWEAYFEARDERVWEWRYCDSWHEPARFNVLFDGTTRRVRTTQSWTESLNPQTAFVFGRHGRERGRVFCHH